MGRVLGLRVQGALDPVRNRGRLEAGLASTSGRNLPKSFDAFVTHPPPPMRYRPRIHSQISRDWPNAATRGGLAHDLGTPDYLLRRRTSSNPTFQLRGLPNR